MMLSGVGNLLMQSGCLLLVLICQRAEALRVEFPCNSVIVLFQMKRPVEVQGHFTRESGPK